MANWWLCQKPRATNSCIVFGIVQFIELFGRDQESTYMYIFLLIFSMTLLAMKWCVCDGWASCLGILFILFMYCFVLVNSRPANCDFLMESNQSSTSTLQITLGFPRHAWNVGILVPSSISECYIWSFRGVSCLANKFLLYFLWQLLQRILPAKRLLRNDGLDFVCQNSFLRCGRVNWVLCILHLSSMILMIHLPRFLCICNYFCFAGIVVETSCTPPIVEEMFVFLLYECVHPRATFYVFFFLLPDLLL